MLPYISDLRFCAINNSGATSFFKIFNHKFSYFIHIELKSEENGIAINENPNFDK